MKGIRPFTLLVFALLLVSAFSLVSCNAMNEYVPSYQVTNSGKNWKKGETRTVPAKDVSPNVKLPNELGGSTITIPQPQVDPVK